jgi:hypothetical protein
MKKKNVYLTQEVVQWYLDHPDIYDFLGKFNEHCEEELVFMLALSMWGREYQGTTQGKIGASPEYIYCEFGPHEGYFTLNSRNRTTTG